jgi:membrane protease YdiL (CAAX protease family)
MANFIYNHDEDRVRAGWRLLIQFIVTVIIIIPLGFLLNAVDYLSIETEVAISLIAFTASVWITGRFLDKRKLSEFGLTLSPTWKRELIAGILAGCIAMIGIWALQWAIGSIRFDGFGWNRAGVDSWFWPVLTNMFVMMCVGFYEELWSRGYQLKVLSEGLHVGPIQPKVAVIIATIVTSLLFGLLHAGNPNANTVSVVNITLAGIMLALPYILTGRLWVSIGIHFSWNFMQGAVLGFPVSGLPIRTSVIQTSQQGSDWFTGGNFGPEAGVVGLIAMTCLTIWIIIAYKPNYLDTQIAQFVSPPESGHDPDEKMVKAEDFVS